VAFRKKTQIAFPLCFLLFHSLGLAQEKAVFPRRIISMAPNLTEIVYDIGAQDLLVGVTDFCKFPSRSPIQGKNRRLGQPQL
jgi:ABC-type hemin transport system substrate-binding protein